jgi:radical SAM superfamily enzyme YgiQ (UPF0313 family)
MQLQYQKYGIRAFKFHDALTNGNTKEFNQLISLMAQWNRENPDARFEWSGYYIFRESSKNDEQLWELLAQSGANWLLVGIENFNEDIRFAMNKKISNKSIENHLQFAKKYKITLLLLLIVGYVTETEEHVQQAKKWLDEHVDLKDYIQIAWGVTLQILTNTYLDRHKEQLGIKMIGNHRTLWTSMNGQNTLELRTKWRDELLQYSMQLGYNVYHRIDMHLVMELLMKKKNSTLS